MSRNDLDILRDRTPDSLEVVRNIITIVELGLYETGASFPFGKGTVTIGSDTVLDASVRMWRQPAEVSGLERHRTVTAHFPEFLIEGQEDRGVLYDIASSDSIASQADPVIVFHTEDDPPAGNLVRCDYVQIAGTTEQRPLLFAAGELEALDPNDIVARLKAFEMLAQLAVGEFGQPRN